VVEDSTARIYRTHQRGHYEIGIIISRRFIRVWLRIRQAGVGFSKSKKGFWESRLIPRRTLSSAGAKGVESGVKGRQNRRPFHPDYLLSPHRNPCSLSLLYPMAGDSPLMGSICCSSHVSQPNNPFLVLSRAILRCNVFHHILRYRITSH